MTTTNLLLLVLILTVFWLGGRILDRLASLPKPPDHADFKPEIPDYFVFFRIDALTENDFDVSFVDAWNVGRPFMLYGPHRMEDDDERLGGLEVSGRVGIHIHPTTNWFERSRLGYIRVYPKGALEGHISLPYQVARHVLEDVRRNPDQIVAIGFRKASGKDGKTSYPIFSFELSEAWDK